MSHLENSTQLTICFAFTDMVDLVPIWYYLQVAAAIIRNKYKAVIVSLGGSLGHESARAHKGAKSMC